jgi:hypothetical protein
MNEWKEAANYRRDVRHGLLNAQDETLRLPKGKKHEKDCIEVHYRHVFYDGKGWLQKTKFPSRKKAVEFMNRMNQLEANKQILRGAHPADVVKPYFIADDAANDEQSRKAA